MQTDRLTRLFFFAILEIENKFRKGREADERNGRNRIVPCPALAFLMRYTEKRIAWGDAEGQPKELLPKEKRRGYEI